MKLPVIDALQTLQLDKRVPVDRFVSFEQKRIDPPEPLRHRDGVVIRTSAFFCVDQTIYEDQPLEPSSRQAKEIIARRVYDPVIDRLRSIAELLYLDGISYDDKVLEAVNNLINDMKVY